MLGRDRFLNRTTEFLPVAKRPAGSGSTGARPIPDWPHGRPALEADGTPMSRPLLLPALGLCLLALLPAATSAAVDPAEARPRILALAELTTPPAMEPAADVPADGPRRAVYFEGLPWRGRPTRVFAWLGLPEAAADPALHRVSLDEPAFRFELNEDAMATDKLAEGIRAFVADARKLEQLIATV